MDKGKLFVVSGPSGAGKSTICQMVREELKINLSVSATTRQPRPGEKDGVDYYYLSKVDFEDKIVKGEFVEYANVHGNYYGTLKSEVEEHLKKGHNLILEIDVQGGTIVKKNYPDAKLIFFKPPTVEELERRLRGRGTESEESVKLRLNNSLKEYEYEKGYDYTVINQEVKQAVHDLKDIILKA